MLPMILLRILIAVMCADAQMWTDTRLNNPGSFQWHPWHCDKQFLLGLNESFVLTRFPPEQRTGLYGYSRQAPPRECTLEFRTADNCSLDFRTTYFERGDVDCDEQFFMIGDESQEQRVCGFARLPKHFSSSGTHLFLSHFQKNSHWRPTIASYVRGVVECRKKEIQCPPQLPQTQIHAFGPREQTCDGAAQDCPVHAFVSIAGQKVDFSSECHAPKGASCSFAGHVYYSFAPLNETCLGPLLPIPNAMPGNCSTAQLSCPLATPNCDYEFAMQFGSTNSITIPCQNSTQPNALCTVQAIYCFTA